MDMNFNNVVQDDNAPRDFSPIPDKTAVRCLMTIRPGGHGDGGFYKLSNNTGHKMLDCEFTVLAGQYAGRKFWDYLHCDPQSGAHQISRRFIKNMIEDVQDIEAGDASENANARRQLQSISELDKIEVCVRVKLETNEQYGDKNKIGFVLTKADRDYVPKTGVAQQAPVSVKAPHPVMAQPTQASASPSWAPNG